MTDYASKRLNKILATLDQLHGVRLDLYAPINEVRAAYREVRASKDRIIHESQFNNYFRDPEYTKHVLLVEAFRIFLSEIAPKRRRRVKRADESKKPSTRRDADEVIKRKQPTHDRTDPATADVQDRKTSTEQKVDMKENDERLINRVADAEVRRLWVMENNAKKTAKKPVNETGARKGLRLIMEAELEQAEVLLAARAMAEDVQDMAEDLASAQVEELMPLIDRMKAEFGPEKANTFNTSVLQTLQAALDAVKAAKNSIDDGVLTLQGKGPVGGDMGAFPAGGEEPAAADAAAPAEVPADGEDLLGDLDDESAPAEAPADAAAPAEAPVDDEFAGSDAAAGAEGEPVGRAKKAESSAPTGNPLNEVVRKPNAPPEVSALIDDFEYYISRRSKTIKEAKAMALRRYKNLYGENSLLSGEHINEELSDHLLRNHKRLTRQSRLNAMRMPTPLSEAVKRVGIREDVFRDHLREFLGRAAAHLPEEQYKSKLQEVSAAIDRNPDAFVSRMLRLVERREMSQIAGYDGYKAFRRHVLDAARTHRVGLTEMTQYLTPTERDVLEISHLHDAINEGGFAKWYESGAVRRAKPLMESLKRVDDKVASYVSALVDRALTVIREYRNEHNNLDEYGREMLKVLNGRYERTAKAFEAALSNHLRKSVATE